MSGVSCQKVFAGVKRGLFSKSPLLRVSFTAFSFCFFFFCATLLKRKRRTAESDDGKERVTLRQAGGYELSQSDNRLHLRCWVRTLQADLRGVVGAAPYRVCANIAGTYLVHRRGGHWSPAHLQRLNSVGGHSICPRRSLYLIRRYFSELLNNLESSKKRLHTWRDCGTIKAEKRRLFAAVTAETEKENQNGDF